jgi:hypothetical protein
MAEAIFRQDAPSRPAAARDTFGDAALLSEPSRRNLS